MSELKDLAWAVQETIDPLPFEQLERRGVRRRRRRQALVATGAAAAVVLAAAVPWSTRNDTQPPIAPSVPPLVNATDPAGEALVRGTNAEVTSITLATPKRWGATWSNCNSWCTYAAVLRREDEKATTPVGSSYWVTLQVGNEMVALGTPGGERPAEDDPASPKTVMFRLTDEGPRSTALRTVAASTTFDKDEILSDEIIPGRLAVLNPEESTVRPLLVEGLGMAAAAVRDSTGRWWVLGNQGGDAPRADIFWTDDGGKTWEQTLLDPDHPGNSLEVSPGGHTLIATTSTSEEVMLVRMSTDRGATWRKVPSPTWTKGTPAVPFNDQAALLLGAPRANPTNKLYAIYEFRPILLDATPPPLTDLARSDGMIYGPTTDKRIATTLDRGTTWRYFEPR
ncbi:hypothetical protein GCM10009789_36690 [Kribbella sancticallisti]|uniref:Exo-alpha-sialidase n=1 Tax=Kribbella sancticallisti TaxID=460087 RepID=A0ABN2DL14_9ACTN